MQYEQLVSEFGYSREADSKAASVLADLLSAPPETERLRQIISDRTVVCAGAGDSLLESIPYLENSDMSCIAADSTLPLLLEGGILPDIVVTDLDGDARALAEVASLGVAIVVHAHGDNIHKLDVVRQLHCCAGTTQTTPIRHVQNYGGFTDGDRAAFLASWFGARRIILCGMDLAGPVTGWSNSTPEKPHKLQAAARLLEWMAEFTQSKLYTISHPLRGFEIIRPDCIPQLANVEHS